jgi:nitrite reductase/ring-hydroxylating ferredoxin subunit
MFGCDRIEPSAHDGGTLNGQSSRASIRGRQTLCSEPWANVSLMAPPHLSPACSAMTEKGMAVPDASSHPEAPPAPVFDSIDLADIREGEINVKVLRSGRKAVILKRGDDITIFGELCPHMGADLSTATYCPNEGTLTCSWHGYVFDANDGSFRENPNEQLLKALRTPSKHYRPEKTPRYRLRRIPFQIKGSRLYFGGYET